MRMRTIGWALTGAATLTEAALSFFGMLTLLSGQPIPGKEIFAASSAVFAATIETEVFSQNILGGIKYAATKDGLKHKLLHDAIIAKYEKDPNTTSEFLKNYYAQHQYLAYCLQEKHAHAHQLSHANEEPSGNAENCLKKGHAHSHQSKRHNDELQKDKAYWNAEIKNTKKQLYWLERSLAYYFHDEDMITSCKEDLQNIFDDNDKKDFFNKYTRKSRQLAVLHSLNFLSIPGAFLSFSFAFHFIIYAIATPLGIVSFISPAGILMLAAAATLAYNFTIYNTCKEIIHRDLHTTYWGNFKKAIITHYHAKNGGKLALLFLSALLYIILITAVTLGTAGTWWHTGISGQVLLFNLHSFTVKLIVGILAGIYTVSSVLFNAKNIATTFNAFSNPKNPPFKQKIIDEYDAIKGCFTQPFKKVIQDENSLLQKTHFLLKPLVVPLALIAYLSLTSVNLLNYLWSASVLILHCICHAATIDKACVPPAVIVTLGGVTEFANDLPYMNHNHSHSSTPEKVFFTLTSPWLLINWVLLGISSGESWKNCWKEAATKFLHKEHHPHEKKGDDNTADILKPELAANWKRQIQAIQCDDSAKSYKKKSPEKATAFEYIATALKTTDSISEDLVKPLQEHRHHRLFRSKKPPKSQQCWESITLAAAG